MVFGVFVFELGVGCLIGVVSYFYVIMGIIFVLVGFLIIEFFGKWYGWRVYFFGVSIVFFGVGVISIVVMIGNWGVLIVNLNDWVVLIVFIIVMLMYFFFVLYGGMIEEILEEINIKFGVIIVWKIEERSLKGYFVLVFMRKCIFVLGWKIYWIIVVGRDEMSIYLIEFYKIVDMVVRYVVEVKNKGVILVVFVEGFELFVMYNDFKVFFKVLVIIYDIFVVENGVFIIFFEEDVWDRRELELFCFVFGIGVFVFKKLKFIVLR